MTIKTTIAQLIAQSLSGLLEVSSIENLLEQPKDARMGDLAFPAFSLAKIKKQAPQLIASELVQALDPTGFEKIEAKGPYVNFFLDKTKVANQVLADVLNQPNYGSSQAGEGRKITIDMSSPNIAKPFSIGHLRSTVIGDSLAYIYQALGYQPVRINHLGDWGKQFGLLITAYQKWGDEAAVKANPIDELLKLYVRINELAETDPSVDEEARAWFLKLEQGDREALDLWQWFRDVSLEEFGRLYDKLDISFDSLNGEAFYNDKMDEVVELLDQKGLLETSQGAMIVNLDKYDLPPALIKKSDGATLYITRDLAAAIYRKRTYEFVKSLYLVGGEQSNHFKQLKAVLTEMGFEWADEIEHVAFGLVTTNGKKLSTRKGNIIRLEPTLDEAVARSLKLINEKNPGLANKDAVAQQVGVGAVKFYDLKSDRMHGYDFNLEDMVSFEGETGPYVQYAHARIRSILRKSGEVAPKFAPFDQVDEEAWTIIKLLQSYPNQIERAARENDPSVIAKFAINLAQSFNKYYAHVRILDADERQQARLALAYATANILKSSLGLLGVTAPDEM